MVLLSSSWFSSFLCLWCAASRDPMIDERTHIGISRITILLLFPLNSFLEWEILCVVIVLCIVILLMIEQSTAVLLCGVSAVFKLWVVGWLITFLGRNIAESLIHFRVRSLSLGITVTILRGASFLNFFANESNIVHQVLNVFLLSVLLNFYLSYLLLCALPIILHTVGLSMSILWCFVDWL